MSELTFEQMLEESLKTIHTGEVVEGTVIDVKPEEAILNIGYKSDGVLTRNEYTNEPNVDLTKVIKAGDTMEEDNRAMMTVLTGVPVLDVLADGEQALHLSAEEILALYA